MTPYRTAAGQRATLWEAITVRKRLPLNTQSDTETPPGTATVRESDVILPAAVTSEGRTAASARLYRDKATR